MYMNVSIASERPLQGASLSRAQRSGSGQPRTWLGWLAAWRLGFVLVVLTGLTACGVLPTQAVRDEPPLPPTRTAGPLDRLAADGPPAGTPPDASAFVLVDDGLDALAARVALIRSAQRTLDWQTYIWANDTTGQLLMRELLRAADRGVRVRLLLDDNNTPGLDPLLNLLDAHPAIAVRLFNPFPSRAARVFDWVSEFPRLNRRMHNKLLVADGTVALLGGRNVGDVYFRASEDVYFDDTDLLLRGPVLAAAHASFERYWHSNWSYGVHGLLAPESDTSEALEARLQVALAQPVARPWRTELRQSPVVRALLQPVGAWTWAPMTLLDDPPNKVSATATAADGVGTGLFQRLEALFGGARESLDLVSAYFVPGEEGTQALTALARKGVQVRVLTNSLATNDVVAAHVGYARHRQALIAGGVSLLEQRSDASVAGTAPPRPRLIASRASLHAKTFVVDAEDVFIGSLNLDARSSRLNTEVGVIVQSPALAAQLRWRLDHDAGHAWQVGWDTEGMYHVPGGPESGQMTRVRGEPSAGWGRRVLVWVLSWFDLDWLL